MTRWERLKAELHRVAEDEEGASLVFAAITLFVISMSIMFVYQMGLVSADRMQIQNSADAAAYSAAQVEANSLNSIGQVNDGMAYINYILLRYTVDAIVYGTIYQFNDHQRPGAKGSTNYVLMGGPDGDSNEGHDRFEHIRKIVEGNGAPLKKGTDWMGELHYAGRVIMASTPRMARETAAHVAKINGASHIAFSEDLDRSFRVGKSGEAGFNELAYSGSEKEFTPALYGRYAKRKVTEITDADGAGGGKTQNKARELPGDSLSWFDRAKGKLSGGSEYYQIRLCWNQKDWEHEGKDSGGKLTMHGDRSYILFQQGAPNGHWHNSHSHEKYDYETGTWIPLGTHGGGSQPGGHWIPEDDDPSIHDEADDLFLKRSPPESFHHDSEKCPTCMIDGKGYPPGRPNGFRSIYSEVKKSSRDSQGKHLKDAYELKFDKLGGPPKPLMIREPLLRSGITVVTWRKGRGMGELFPESDWGMIAVASAQVGYQTDKGVLPLARLQNSKATYKNRGGGGGTEDVPYHDGDDNGDPKFRNLFYSKKKEDGVRFGARLVPIAWDKTWHPDLDNGKGLKAMLEDSPNFSGKVWYKTDKKKDLTEGTPPDLKKLERYVKVDSEDSLKKFWH